MGCSRIALAALLPAMAAAGCGGVKEVRAPASTARIRVDEYRLVPQKIRVKGPRVRLVLTDAGILTHNLKVYSTHRVDDLGKPLLIGGTKTAHAGETVADTITLPPGRYRLACSIANHDDLGEHGVLIVSGRSSRRGGES